MYVLFASLALILVFYFWRPIPDVVWNVRNTFLIDLIWTLFFSGFFIVLLATFLINHFNLFGLQQVYRNLKGEEQVYPNFVKPFFYKVVCHPLYLGFFIAFWAIPTMTIGHLLFSFATTGYMMAAIQLEERDLIKYYGDKYMQYQHEVSMIIPLPPKQEETAGVIQNSTQR